MSDKRIVLYKKAPVSESWWRIFREGRPPMTRAGEFVVAKDGTPHCQDCLKVISAVESEVELDWGGTDE